MHNIEKFYQVFISSTFLDLQEERTAIMQLLYTTNFVPRGMELFPNGKPDVWELIKEIIDQCDLYILITAGRYGSLSADGKSFTEREFDYAVEKGKPILVYQHKEPDSHNPDKSREEADELKSKLRSFQQRVKNRTVKFWGTIPELERHLAMDLAAQGSRLEGGWIRQRYGMHDSFTEELRLLEKTFESQEVANLTNLLNKALQDFKFGRTAGRIKTLGELIPWLSEREWSLLMDFAIAQAWVRGMPIGANEKPLNKPMYDSILDMINYYEQQLKNFESGTFEVDGHLFDKVSKHFVSSVKQEFLALSNNDFGFWGDDASKDYYHYNLELIERGVVIKRVFAIPHQEFNNPHVYNAISKQIKDKIQTAIISTEQLKTLTMGVWEEDFAIHDDFAVSFFRPYIHRVYRVITQPQNIKKYRDLYHNIAANAQAVPGKVGEHKRLFQNQEDFDLWINGLNGRNS